MVAEIATTQDCYEIYHCLTYSANLSPVQLRFPVQAERVQVAPRSTLRPIGRPPVDTAPRYVAVHGALYNIQ